MIGGGILNARGFLVLLFIIFLNLRALQAENSCGEFLNLSSQAINQELNTKFSHEEVDFNLVSAQLKYFLNENAMLETLLSENNLPRFRLHTSKSIHRASDEYPRLIFLDEARPENPVVYALSTQVSGPPVVEIQSFDTKNLTTQLYRVKWLSDGEFALEQNPRQCFACHSGGRPLLAGMGSKMHWPFAFNDDVEIVNVVYKKLSQMNTSMQLNRLHQIRLDPKWLKLLQTALVGTEQDFKSQLKRFPSAQKFDPEQIYDLYFNQRDIFLNLVGYKTNGVGPLLDETDLKTIRVLQAFQAVGMHDFLDLLSLNVRPRNYEIGPDVIKDLEQWVLGFELPEASSSGFKWKFW